MEDARSTPAQWIDQAGVMLFKVPVGETWIVSICQCSNTDTAERTIAMHKVPDGDSPSDENKIVPDSTLKVGMFMECLQRMVFEAEEELWGVCDEDDVVNVTVSYARRDA
jgi:hypothetical protein